MLADQGVQLGGLDRVGARPLHGARHPVGRLHGLGQRRQRLAHPVGHVLAPAERLADDEPEAVDQAPQRRRHVGVGGGDGRVRGCAGTSPSNGVYPAPRNSAVASWMRAEVPRVGPVEGPQELAVGQRLSPLHAQRRGLSPEARQAAGSGGGIVRRMPILPFSIMSAAPIPVIREIWAFQSSAGSGGRKEMPVVPLLVLVDLLLGHRQAGAAAACARAATRFSPDLLQQHQPLVGGAGVDLLLHLLVVVAPDAAHHGAVDLDRGALAVGRQRHVPDEGRAHLAGQQARGALAQLRRVQRDALVGA